MLLLVETLLLIAAAAAQDSDPTVVSTALGKVKGLKMTSYKGREFVSFRGVPFAKPPINSLRFEDPVEVEPWSNILDATKEGPFCTQYDGFTNKIYGTEDCLALNIYTHSVDPEVPKRPVMVFIHGGAYYFGSGNGETYYYGPNFYLDRDIVLVTINYRVGSLGFLSTHDKFAPGNYGLLDQELALRWIQKHIEAFGGDPKSVTIFGESAGAASVEHLVLSPRTKGLFHRAIAQSGSALCPWAIGTQIKSYSMQLAARLNCPIFPSWFMLNCLRTKDAKDFAQFQKDILKITVWPLPFVPRIDRERQRPFVPKHPREVLEKGNYHHVPYISGVNRNETAFVIGMLLANNGVEMQKLDNNIADTLPYLLSVDHLLNSRRNSLAAFKYYFGNIDKPSKNLQKLEEMLSNSVFFQCTQASARLHAKHSSKTPNYAYLYSHRGALTFPTFLGSPTTVELGVSHIDELLLMFSSGQTTSFQTPDDERVSSILLDYWTNFAITGVPSSSAADKPWVPVSKDQMRYLQIQVNPTLVNSSYYFDKDRAFWEDFYKPTSWFNLNNFVLGLFANPFL